MAPPTPTSPSGIYFEIRQNSPSEELIYDEANPSNPFFGTLLVRTLPNTDYTVHIDEVFVDLNCGGTNNDLVSSQLNSGSSETMPEVTNSCGTGNSEPEFLLQETSYDPSTNRFEGDINVTGQVTASETMTIFKISPISNGPSIETINVSSLQASSQDVNKNGDDWYLTLNFVGNISPILAAASLEVTYAAGTPPNSVEFEFSRVNAVAVPNFGACCQVDVETSTHPIGTTAPCVNQSGVGGSLDYGYATFVAEASSDCGVDIQLGWNADPSISGTMQWLGTPQSAIKVFLKGENIATPIAIVNTENCMYNNSTINVQQVGVTTPAGISTYEIGFEFFNSNCITDGPFLDIKVPTSDPSLDGKITSVQYTSAVANISPSGPSGGGNCSHAATGISDEIILTGDFGGQVLLACDNSRAMEDVEICFTQSCPLSPLPFCSSNTNALCEGTSVTDADGAYIAPTSLTGETYFATPVCNSSLQLQFATPVCNSSLQLQFASQAGLLLE